LGNADRRPRRPPRAHHPQGRVAITVRSAVGLRVSSALSAGLRALPARSARARRNTHARERVFCGEALTHRPDSRSPTPPTLDELRRYAVARTLFAPTTLLRAIEKLGFVQADPIRAPARAQDLILRHRVRNYRAGDLERRYARLAIEEDFFVNY